MIYRTKWSCSSRVTIGHISWAIQFREWQVFSYKTGSNVIHIGVQVNTWCHYLNQCQLILIEVFWYSPEDNHTGNAEDIYPIYEFKDDWFKITDALPRGQWVTLCLQPYKLHKLEDCTASKFTVTRDDAIKYYREMFTIRRMETAAWTLYEEKAIHGFCHLYSGQVSLLLD